MSGLSFQQWQLVLFTLFGPKLMAVYCAVVIFCKCCISDARRHRQDQRLCSRGKPNCFLHPVLHSHRHHHHFVLSFIWLLATLITILNRPDHLLRVIKVFMSYFTYRPRSWASFPKNIQKHFGRKFNIVFLLILGQ